MEISKRKVKIYFTDYKDNLLERNVKGEKNIRFNWIGRIIELLEKHYEVIITSQNPDVVFCDIYGVDFSKYDCIRVGICFEEYAPNFNVYDYVYSLFMDYNFMERVFFSQGLLLFPECERDYNLALNKHFNIEKDIIKSKDFCCFVQSNSIGADDYRKNMFYTLSKYKRVNSGGGYLNNIGELTKDKVKFEMQHKFSISMLNARNYTIQDRPTDAFAAKTVPIYWGNPHISKIFNANAFINCMEFDNIDSVVNRVIEIDNNEELFIKMLKEPAFVKQDTYQEELNRLEEWIVEIVENGTVQRSKAYWNRWAEKEIVVGRRKITKLERYAHKCRPIMNILNKNIVLKKIKSKVLNKLIKYRTKNIKSNSK